MNARKMVGIVPVMLLLTAGAAQAAITIDTVPVGNPGNAGDTRYAATPGYGAVSYEYNIGKYEVTAGQYTAFLNAVAKIDTYGLYNTAMDSSSYDCQITRRGTSGNYTYDFSGRPSGTEADWANRPVNIVSFWDAYRFANWLNNGQPTGAQGAGTTERGAYTLDGYNGIDGRTIQRNTGATWAVTSEDEWYKAAYYKGGSTNAGYWDYPTQSDTAPSNVGSDGYTDPGNHANYYNNGYTIGSPYYRTNVGEFENSASPYGTFDQGGNVWEWNEAIPYQDSTYASRGLRGGSFGGYYDGILLASVRYLYGYDPTVGYSNIGFRVVQVPEPAPPAPRTYGIFIGSLDYTDGGEDKVNGIADAYAVKAKLDVLLGLTDARVLSYAVPDILSSPWADVRAVLDGFTNSIRPGDTFIFYYMGHGGGSYTDVGVDETLTPTWFWGIKDDDLAAWFLDSSRRDKWDGVNKLFILDTCHGGGFWDGEDSDLSGLDKVALLAGGSELESAYANADGRGYFSLALEEGLEKVGGWARADVGRDGLSVQDLSDWLRDFPAYQSGITGYLLEDGWSDELFTGQWAFQVQASSDFDLDKPIPEPAALSLLALGGLAMLRRRRK